MATKLTYLAIHRVKKECQRLVLARTTIQGKAVFEELKCDKYQVVNKP